MSKAEKLDSYQLLEMMKRTSPVVYSLVANRSALQLMLNAKSVSCYTNQWQQICRF